MSITKINKYNKKKQQTEQHFYNEDKKANKYTPRLRYIMNTSRILLKLKNTKNKNNKKNKLKYKVLKNKYITDKD